MLAETVDFDLDALIEASVAQAQMADGVNPSIVAARSRLDARGLLMVENATPQRAPQRANAARWTQDEIDFLRAWHNILSEREIAEALGRSQNGVHIFSERNLGLPRPTKDPRYVTTGQIAEALGVDRSTPANWIDAGVLSGYLFPFETRRVLRVVKRTVFLMWVVNPMNWIYFDPKKVQDPYLRRLLELKRARWGDEWWTPGQVARYHGWHRNSPHKQIVRRVGRGAVRWGNHYILRSVAVNLKLYQGKGSASAREYSAAGDAFLVLARAVGIAPKSVTEMLTRHYGFSREKIGQRRVPDGFADPWFVAHRIAYLRNTGQLDEVLTSQRLRVVVGKQRLDVFADWKKYRRRFPTLARAMDKFRAVLDGGEAKLSEKEMWVVRWVLARWAMHFIGNAGFMNNNHGVSTEWLVRAYERLRARGVDPYEEGYMDISQSVSVQFHAVFSDTEAQQIVADPTRFVRELKAAMNEAGVGVTKMSKKVRTKAERTEMACPHCERAGLRGIHGVNRHIGSAHPGKSKVTALDVVKSNGHLVPPTLQK